MQASLKNSSETSTVVTITATASDLEKYKAMVTESARMSEIIHKNFAAVSTIIEKVNSMQQISAEKIQQLNALAISITQASSSLSDERTLVGLKHLEAIVKK